LDIDHDQRGRSWGAPNVRLPRPAHVGSTRNLAARRVVPSQHGQHLHSISAAVLRRPGGALVIEDLVMEGPHCDELLVRLAASGIFHTDIDFCDSGASGPR
jgi:hypothetical protein